VISVTASPQICAGAAFEVVSASASKAKDLGVSVCIAVYAASGHEVAFLRLDNAPDMCAGIARDKAYTAACFGQATHAWADLLAAEHTRVLAGLQRVPRFVTVGGGLPLKAEKDLIGGIGVSGGSEEQDIVCAAAGVQVLNQ